MLSVDDLRFSYRAGGTAVLDGVSFSVSPGQLVAVLGANGAGKSTLFRCVLGFERNYTGSVLLDGRELRTMTRREVAGYMAYVPQSETPVFNYTVFDTVLMGTTGTLPAFSSPGQEQIDRAKNAVELLEIEHLASRGVNEISGGERQLTMLARAVAQQAKLMILDEPTANLDYGNQQLVLRNARRMTQEGYTILFSTHNPEHALQYASHVLVLQNNRVAAFGETDCVVTEKLIKTVYGLDTRLVSVTVGGRTVKTCLPVSEEGEI